MRHFFGQKKEKGKMDRRMDLDEKRKNKKDLKFTVAVTIQKTIKLRSTKHFTTLSYSGITPVEPAIQAETKK